MKKKKALGLIALTLLLCACDSKTTESSSGSDTSAVSSAVNKLVNSSYKDEYSPESVALFMNSCTSTGSSVKSCSCVMDKIQEKISFKEFAEADLRASAGQSPGEKFIKVMTDARITCQ